MRRTLVLLSALVVGPAAGLVVTAGPSEAATTVVSHSGLPAPIISVAVGTCGTTTFGTSEHVNGPATPPLGVGSLEVDSGSADAMNGVGYNFNGLAASSLTAFSVAHYETVTHPPNLLFSLQIDPDGTGQHMDQMNYQAAPTDGAWQGFDAMTTPLTWWHDGSPLNAESYAQYVSDHPDATLEWGSLFVYNCPDNRGAVSAYFDDWIVGINGADTTYDFEAPLASVTGAVSASTVTAGKPVTVTGTVKADGSPVTDTPLQLWAKTYPATAYRQVGVFTTNGSGVASAVDKPLVATSYQWRLPPTTYAPASSTAKPVAVRTALSANVDDKTLTTTQPLLLWGVTKAERPGATVTLRRSTSSGTIAVQSATVRSDGTYLFKHTLPKGIQHVFVHIGAGGGDLAGNSPSVRVTVG